MPATPKASTGSPHCAILLETIERGASRVRVSISSRRGAQYRMLAFAACMATSACLHESGPRFSDPPADLQAVATVAFTEGPTVDRDGRVYFSEMLSGRILVYTPESLVPQSPAEGGQDQRALGRALGGGVEIFREPSQGANGLIIDPQRRLIAAEIVSRRVTRTDLETGAIEVLAENSPATPIDMPNDVTLDGSGRIYFSDFVGRRVYRIDPDGRVERILGPDQVEAPNGLVVAPGDATLYVVEANSRPGGARLIRAYDLAADGSLRGGRVFHDFGKGRSADGLAIDAAGNVYAAAGLHRRRGTSETLDTPAGVHVFAPDGRPIAFHPIPEDSVTNLAFGGQEMRTLYVTAGKTLFSLRVDEPGTPR